MGGEPSDGVPRRSAVIGWLLSVALAAGGCGAAAAARQDAEQRLLAGHLPGHEGAPSRSVILRSYPAPGRCDDFAPAYGCSVTEVLELDERGEPVKVVEHQYVYHPVHQRPELWRTRERPLGSAETLYP